MIFTIRRGYQITQNIKFDELASRLVECPEPTPATDEVLVDVHYAGLNVRLPLLFLYSKLTCSSGSSSTSCKSRVRFSLFSPFSVVC
jgi:hypothetical protein